MSRPTTFRQVAFSWLRFFAIVAFIVASVLFDWITIDPMLSGVLGFGLIAAYVVYAIRYEEAELERVDPDLMLDYEEDLEQAPASRQPFPSVDEFRALVRDLIT
ncbi:MAG: hypothetical protein AAGE94_14010 [Acidobacteriota bacterium]